MDDEYHPPSRQDNYRDSTSSSVGPTRQKKSSTSSPYTRNQSSSTNISSSTRNHASNSRSYEESRASTPLSNISDYEVSERESNQVEESTFILLQPNIPLPKKIKVSHARKTPPGHIKRPPNAFILFRSHCCTPPDSPSAVNFSAPGTPSAKQLSELGITDHRHISRITSHLWKSLTSVERGFWERQAVIKKEEHKVLFPDYKYKPIYRNKDKVRRRRKGEPGEMEEEKKGCEEVARALLNGPRARILAEVDEYDQPNKAKDSRSTRFALPSTHPSTKKSSTTSNKKTPAKALAKVSTTPKKSTSSTRSPTRSTEVSAAEVVPATFAFPQVDQTDYDTPQEPVSSSSTSSLDQFYKQQQQKSQQLQNQHHRELHRALTTPQVVRSTQFGYFDQPHTNAQQLEHQRQQQQRQQQQQHQQQQQQQQSYYNQSTQYSTQRNQNDYSFPTGATPLPSTPTSQSLDEATRSFYAHRNSDAPVGLKKRGQLGVIAKDGEGSGGDLMLISAETGARKFSIGQWAAGDVPSGTGADIALASPLVAFEFDPDFLQSVMRGAQLNEKSEGIEYEYVNDDAEQDDRNRRVAGGERRMIYSWAPAPLYSKNTPNKDEGYHVLNQDYFSRPTTDPFQTPRSFDYQPSSEHQNQQSAQPSLNSPSFGGSFRPDSPGMFSRYSNNSISHFDQQHQQQPFTPNAGRFSMTWSGRSRNNSEATLRVGDGLGRRESLEEGMRRLEREAAVAVLKQSQDQMPPSTTEGVHQGYIFLSREQAMDQLLVDQILLYAHLSFLIRSRLSNSFFSHSAGFGVTHEPFDT